MAAFRLNQHFVAAGKLLAGIAVQVDEFNLASQSHLLLGIENVVEYFVDENAIADRHRDACVVETGFPIIGIANVCKVNPDLSPGFHRPWTSAHAEDRSRNGELICVEVDQTRLVDLLQLDFAIRQLHFHQ